MRTELGKWVQVVAFCMVEPLRMPFVQTETSIVNWTSPNPLLNHLLPLLLCEHNTQVVTFSFDKPIRTALATLSDFIDFHRVLCRRRVGRRLST